MPGVSFDELVLAVEETASSDTPLARLRGASTIGAALVDGADALVTHFVDRCRADGHTWAEIGDALGVSKQAAQQRFVDANTSRLTARTKEVLATAREIADDQGAAALRLDHLLVALFSQPDTIGAKVLRGLGIQRDALDEAVGRATRARGARLSEAPAVDQVLLATALSLGHNYVGTEHVLLACHRDPSSPTARALDDLGATESAVREAVMVALGKA